MGLGQPMPAVAHIADVVRSFNKGGQGPTTDTLWADYSWKEDASTLHQFLAISIAVSLTEGSDATSSHAFVPTSSSYSPSSVGPSSSITSATAETDPVYQFKCKPNWFSVAHLEVSPGLGHGCRRNSPATNGWIVVAHHVFPFLRIVSEEICKHASVIFPHPRICI